MSRRAGSLHSSLPTLIISLALAVVLLTKGSDNVRAQESENELAVNESEKVLPTPVSESPQGPVPFYQRSPLSTQPGNRAPLDLTLASPAVVQPIEAHGTGVEWRGLFKGSMNYLGTMHAFRIMTEKGTRQALHNSVVGGYFKALGAMHGWSDGDGYYENYLGHPIQGAVSGYIWIRNDSRYRNVQFGADRDYWMSRLRAYAFAWAFSEQFEIGPISEASIGQIQRYCCAYGFVDHIITPNGGLVWMIGADALDRYVTVPLERHTENKFIRIFARIALNPPQGFANLMMMEKPWRRENRQAVSDNEVRMHLQSSQSLFRAVRKFDPTPALTVPKFEISGAIPSLMRFGNRTCLGGYGVGAFRANEFLQWTGEVGGCTLSNSLPTNWTGDSLTFTAGPQFTLRSTGRWRPSMHLRVGGQKIAEEREDPVRKGKLLAAGERLSDYRDAYIQHFESTGFSLSMGGGLDVAVNKGLALRLANLDYVRSWLGGLNGTDFDHGFRFSSGLTVRIGTW